jgi:hypothetical protein
MLARLEATEGRAWLRPHSTGEAVDSALRLYQRSAWPLLSWTLLPMSLCFASLVFMAVVVVPSLFMTRTPGQVGGEVTEVVTALGVGVLVALPLFCLGIGTAMGTVVRAAADLLHGLPLDERRAKSAGRASLGAVAGGLAIAVPQSLLFVLLAGLLLLLGMLADRIGGGWVGATVANVLAVLSLAAGFAIFPFALATRALTPAVAVIEGAPAMKAIARSRALMRQARHQGSPGSVCLTVAVLILFVGGMLWGTLQTLVGLSGVESRLENLPGFPGVGPMLAGAVGMLPAFVVLWLMSPLWSVAMTVLYYDRVVRLEAYDVRLMVEEIANADRRAVLLR